MAVQAGHTFPVLSRLGEKDVLPSARDPFPIPLSPPNHEGHTVRATRGIRDWLTQFLDFVDEETWGSEKSS